MAMLIGRATEVPPISNVPLTLSVLENVFAALKVWTVPSPASVVDPAGSATVPPPVAGALSVDDPDELPEKIKSPLATVSAVPFDVAPLTHPSAPALSYCRLDGVDVHGFVALDANGPTVDPLTCAYTPEDVVQISPLLGEVGAVPGGRFNPAAVVVGVAVNNSPVMVPPVVRRGGAPR